MHTAGVDVETSDHLWTWQVGAALSEPDAARLLGVSANEVRRMPGLLRVRTRDGEVVYPVVQFEPGSRRQVPEVATVVETLRGVLEPLTIVAWLTARNRQLADRPIDLLRRGDIDRVLMLARQLANDAGS